MSYSHFNDTIEKKVKFFNGVDNVKFWKRNIENIQRCSFVLTDENKTAVAIKINIDGELVLEAKGQAELAIKIVEEAKKLSKFIVESNKIGLVIGIG